MNIKQKIALGAATVATLGTAFVPMASAANTVTIQGNGAGSHNTVVGVSVKATKVKQSNTTVANTFVLSASNTGGNKANGNTGGAVTQTTGAATSTVAVSVTGGSNTASLPDCGCPQSDNSVSITDNGAGSHNTVLGFDINLSKTKQSSTTVANTAVISVANTGGNKANWNTGGDVDQTSGPATSEVGVVVTGGDNTLN